MKKFLLFISVVAAGLASCSKEDLSPDKSVTGIPLTVSSASIDATVTRGTVEVTAENAQVGVYQIANVGGGYGGTLKGYQYNSASTPKWHALSGDIYLNNNLCDVIGVYPYTAIGSGTATDPTQVPLTSQILDATSTQDLCYQKVTGLKNSSYSVTFDQMQHAYAKLTFRINKDAISYTGSGILNSITINNAAIIKSCPFDLTVATQGTATLGDVSAGIPTSLNVTIPASTATPAYVDESFLMIPVSGITGDINLTFDVDGTSLKGAIASTGTPSLAALAAGHEYIVTVTLQGTALTIVSVKVVDWVTDTTWNGSQTPLVPTTN